MLTHPGRVVRWVAVGLTVALVAALVVVALVQARRYDAARTVPTPAASRDHVPSPTHDPDPTPTSDGPTALPANTPMGGNPLHLVAPTATDCGQPLPAPPLATPDSAAQAQLQAVADCLTRAWGPSFEATTGIRLRSPVVRAVTTGVDTPCGPDIENGYYCTLNETLYLRVDALRAKGALAGSPMAAVAMVAHEYGHHLQSASGVWRDFALTQQRADDVTSLELRRRLELQSDCTAGVSLAAVQAGYGLTPADVASWDAVRQGFADARHGSVAAQAAWEHAGRAAGNMGVCNTWEAPLDRING